MAKNPNIYKEIACLLNTLCNDIKKPFEENELAYLTLQGKNELQIRDRIAWEIQKDLDNKHPNQYIVRREWSNISRSKVDLAILEVDGDINTECDKFKVVALIEFKAHSFLNKENWPYAEFIKDVSKMKEICDNSKAHCDEETQMYFIFMHSCQSIKSKSLAVTYPDILNHKKTFVYGGNEKQCKKEMQSYWDKFFENSFTLKQQTGISKYGSYIGKSITLKKKFAATVPSFQNVGSSFGVSIYVSPMIWGPVRRNEITIQ